MTPGQSASRDATISVRPTRQRLLDIAAVFLKLGTTAFGGPAAHVAMMEHELVRRRGWLTQEDFLDRLGAANVIPGPNSTELAIHVGHARGGWPGLFVSGACFIVPAALMVTAIAWAYVRYGQLPAFAAVLWGVKPVVLAVIAQALWSLTRTAVKSRWLALVGSLALVATVAGVHELAVLAAAGVCCALARAGTTRRVAGTLGLLGAAGFPGGLVGAGTAVAAPTPFALLPLFLVFAKIGAVLFGSGYVLLAFLRADLVVRLGWLTEAQLLDAIAVGQVTPGPVFTAATFVGYLLGGLPGALVATLGIFLPAFVFVAISGPLVPRIRRSAVAGAALDGVNVASLALMGAVSWQLGLASLTDPLAWTLAGLAGLALFRWPVNSAWLVLGGGLVGWATAWLRG